MLAEHHLAQQCDRIHAKRKIRTSLEFELFAGICNECMLLSLPCISVAPVAAVVVAA